MPVIPIERPSRYTPEEEKGEGYHAACLRYYLGKQNAGASFINWYRSNYARNSAYAIDSRFAEEEVERMFLGDGPSATSRVPFKHPIISPMLTRMIGGVDNIAINAQAELVTQWFAQTRREEALNQRVAMSLAARGSAAVAGAFAPMGISPNEEKTVEQFDATFQDKIQKGENALMQMLAVRHKLMEQKRKVAQDMALSGVAAAHFYINGQNIELEFCDPSEVGWDMSAIRPDFTDSEALWTCPLMSISAMAERWPDKEKEVRGVERWANQAIAQTVGGGYWPQARPRVFTVYWKDSRKVERGFVVKDGEVEFCTINAINPDTGKVEYTDNDLVDPPAEFGMYYQAWTEKEKRERKQTKWIEEVRYCSAIPWEYMPGSYTQGQKFAPKMFDTDRTKEVGVLGDLVFDYGVYPLQEADPDDQDSVKFPIKIQAWRYVDGFAVAPISAAIDPQQWMNQITSDLAWRMRKAGGQYTAVEKSALAGGGQSEEAFNLAKKEGDTVVLDGSSFGGINNAIKQVDESPGAGFYNMMGQLPVIKGMAESAIGVSDTMQGAPVGPNQLVGTMQLQLQQAGAMQQPYYASIVDFFKQLYQFEAQGGKQFYGRRPWLLSRMVSDGEEMQSLIASRDMQMEQFRVTVTMELDNKQLRTITDQQIIPTLMQFGMLDPVTAAQLMGRAVPEDAYAAARSFTKQAQMAQADQAEKDQQGMMMGAMAQEQQNIDEQEMEMAKMENSDKQTMAKIQGKLMQPEAQALSEHLKPVEMPA
jgi:hypothetical protein